MSDILSWISLITGIVSIVLGIVSLIKSAKDAKSSQDNYEKTKRLLDEIQQIVLTNQKAIGYTEKQLSDI